jgi:hypothetical protein
LSSTATRRRAAGARASALSARDAAWLAALPCAALTLLLIVALGPLVGDLLLPPSSVAFFDLAQPLLHPEPHEQGRFLVALAGPPLLAGATVALRRHPPPVPASAVAPLVWIAQAAVAAFAVVCVVVQRGLVYGFEYQTPEPFGQAYFSDVTLTAAVLGAIAIVAAARSARARALAARWASETSARRIAWTLAAALLTAVWMLHALVTEGTLAGWAFPAADHLQYTLDETYAVLNGRTPLVDFAAQYGSLWPYPVAAAMALLGSSIGVFSAAMCLISGLALLAMHDVLRRAARSSLAALLLFAPFLATSFFLLRGPLESRYTFGTIYADYPLRFAGPWLLMWLAARHLDGARPRAAWPLFLAGGLVVMNNTDHGLPALAGLAAALLWAGGPVDAPPARRLRALAVQAGIGLLGAFALVSALTLVRAGALPDPALMVRFARLFAVAGFAMLPMPELGLHTVLYLTFAGALAVATVRAIDAAPDRALTGALAFSAIFGLASGGYYVGRSHPEVLVGSFAIWSFTLALLTVVALRRLAARPAGWPDPATAACLVAFGLAVCSLAQTPTPWSQVDRLRTTGPATLRAPAGQPFVAAHVRRGEPVAILLFLGHRMAENVGVENVTPYTSAGSMPAVSQLDDTIRALREAGGRKVFLNAAATGVPNMRPALADAGFARAAGDREGYEMWIDRAGPTDAAAR